MEADTESTMSDNIDKVDEGSVNKKMKIGDADEMSEEDGDERSDVVKGSQSEAGLDKTEFGSVDKKVSDEITAEVHSKNESKSKNENENKCEEGKSSHDNCDAEVDSSTMVNTNNEDVANEKNCEMEVDVTAKDKVEVPIETDDDVAKKSDYSSSNNSSMSDEEDRESTLAIDTSCDDIQPLNIREGKAEILVPSSNNVFYNPVQEFNRDLSIAVLTVFSENNFKELKVRERGTKRKSAGSDDVKSDAAEVSDEPPLELKVGKRYKDGITILEALSGTGLRSIRYALEVPGLNEVIANDLSSSAYESIKASVEHNGVEEIVMPTHSDASMLMYNCHEDGESYDAVDLDPYGCPARFLDAAVKCVRDGGLLLVTCTDLAILAGNAPETCYAKYSAVSLRNTACHEMALRIALKCICSHANRYGRYIVPLLSVSADFYIRLFVQVYTAPVQCKRATSKLSHVYQCVGCHTLTLQRLGLAKRVGENANQMKYSLPKAPPVDRSCEHCGRYQQMGGPIWTGPLHDMDFIDRVMAVAARDHCTLATAKRIEGMLAVMREELNDVPLYYTLDGLCSTIHCTVIPQIDFRSALLNAGYRVSLSHASPTSVKTNAPASFLWDIIRCWVKRHPVAEKRLTEGSVASRILQSPSVALRSGPAVDFTYNEAAVPPSQTMGLLRFQLNPQPNWGPGARARINTQDESRRAKSRENQNKHSGELRPMKKLDIIEIVTLTDDDDDEKSSHSEHSAEEKEQQA